MRTRDLMRWIHLIGAAVILTFVYSPWRNEATFLLSMRVLVIPILGLTGLWMWQGHKLEKLLGSSNQKVKTS